MTKLNAVVFNKLMAQAEEAQARGLIKLAEDIKQAIGTEPSSDFVEYSYSQLREDVRQDLWKLATRLMMYYNVESADADKLQHTILDATAQIMNDFEESLGVDEVVVGPLEPSVSGQTKLGGLDPEMLEWIEQNRHDENPSYKHMVVPTYQHMADKILSKKCINCGHHENDHLTAGPGDSEQCQALVGGGYRTAPRKCDCIGFNLKSR